VAATDRQHVYRGTFRRTHTDRHRRAARSAKPLSFLPGIQAIFRNDTAPIPDQLPDRTRQATAGNASGVGDGRRPDGRLQQLECVRYDVPKSDGVYAHPLPQELGSSIRFVAGRNRLKRL